jgi:hypothetical protein
MMNKKNESLADKFNKARKKVQGTMDLDVLESEFGNLCDKFEFLWDQAESTDEKISLGSPFAALMVDVASNLKEQSSVAAIETSTAIIIKMTSTAQKLDPERSIFTRGNSYLFQKFQAEAPVLSIGAKGQENPFARKALLRAVDALTTAAYAFHPVVPPAPEPEPTVLPKEPVPPFRPVLDKEVRQAMKALSS